MRLRKKMIDHVAKTVAERLLEQGYSEDEVVRAVEQAQAELPRAA